MDTKEAIEKPKSREPGMAESDYMSIEQRKKFEAGHVPEKVEASELAKRARRAIADIVVAAPDDEQAVKEAMKILYKACDRLEAAEKELDDYHNAEKMANISPCDEVHCGCVPLLLKTIKQLQASLEAAEKDLAVQERITVKQIEENKQLQAKLEALKE